METPGETYSRQLQQFLWATLLPAVPRLAWWVVGLLVFSVLNLFFQQELWPHYPQAGTWFWFSMMPCLAILPWLGAYTARQVQRRMQGWWWRGLWQLATIGAYLGAVLLSILLAIGFLILLANNQW